MDENGTEPLLLHALADGELDAATALALERKIAVDPALAAEYERICALQSAVARQARPAVSRDFAARIAALASAVTPLPSTSAPARRPAADWRALAACLVLTAALASGLTYAVIGRDPSLSIEESIVAGHRRSLLAASPIDIASSDRHTVRPWFDKKLGISPPTPDLTAVGFSLLGGRVDIVEERPVPSLVYRHKEHLISVVAMPAASGHDVNQAPVPSTAGTYNVMRWSRPGFRYWAVSDLEAAELATFVDALRAQGD